MIVTLFKTILHFFVIKTKRDALNHYKKEDALNKLKEERCRNKTQERRMP